MQALSEKRQTALARLQKQLQAKKKIVDGQPVELTEKDIKRIEKEIEVLKERTK